MSYWDNLYIPKSIKSIVKAKITITLTEKVLKNIDSLVDNIFIRNRSHAIEYLIEKRLDKAKTGVILATGPSKELLISKGIFRATARIANNSLIELNLISLRSNGFKKIYIVGEQQVLTSVFSRVGDGMKYGIEIKYIEDNNPPGTGESLRLLKGDLKGTFLVLYGDTLVTKEDIDRLWKKHFDHNDIMTVMVAEASLLKGGSVLPIKKSFIKYDGDMITKTFPKHDGDHRQSKYAMTSMFIAEPEIFSYTGNWIEKDIIPAMVDKEMVHLYLSNSGELHIHSKEDLKFVKDMNVL
jgi:NDP-sugar pyrophosphorylase family protein